MFRFFKRTSRSEDVLRRQARHALVLSRPLTQAELRRLACAGH